jgi:arylsulfatase A-like enzyme
VGWAGTDVPNVVFILADDMGYGDVACLNPKSKIPTPNLDALAAQGMRFTDAHSSSSVCSPTRYSILTGRYAWRTPLTSSVLWPWDRPLIEPDRMTLGKMLQERGYATACIGKWHLGWDWPTHDNSQYEGPLTRHDNERRAEFAKRIDYSQPIMNGPLTRGFDYYFGDDVPNFPPYCFIENDRTLGIPAIAKPEEMFGWDGVMVEGWDLAEVLPALFDKSVEYIESQSIDNPFFLFLPLTAPHTPIAPREDFVGKSDAGPYGDFVHEIDWGVGRILRALDTGGFAENTLVVFTSDNGSPARDGVNMRGETRSVHRFDHRPSHIFRGIKADIWEGGHRVPFILRWPGQVAEGTESNALICSMDFMATCAELLNYALPETAAEDSISFLPALSGKMKDTAPRTSLVHHSLNGLFAIRAGDWKFIDGMGSGGWDKAVAPGAPAGQLYDLSSDPSESANRYPTKPVIVDEMRNLLEHAKR